MQEIVLETEGLHDLSFGAREMVGEWLRCRCLAPAGRSAVLELLLALCWDLGHVFKNSATS